MKEPWNGPIQKVNDYCYEIPQSYKAGMRVPGRIYANERLLKDIIRDRAPEQVANAAFLPGIVKYSLAMPDIHWGYGFCLTRDTKILTNFGFYRSIHEFEKNLINQNLKSIDLNSQRATETPILRFIKLKPRAVFKVITKEGYKIEATSDHPLYTPLGMRPIKELSSGDKVAIFPFKGVPYEEPSNEVIISEKQIREVLLKLGRKPTTPKFEIILRKLKKRHLLPLTYKHSKLSYILKIIGFVFGDASMNFIGERGDGVLHFAGKPEDLEEVRKDLKKIGYTPSPLHFRKTKLKDSQGNNKYYDSYSFSVNASSLVVLLEALGVPRGDKVSQAYGIPKWIFKAPLWQKRLFLASLFGCELRIPHRRLGRRGYFNAPSFPMGKREELIKNGKDFLEDISKLLEEFGVKTLYIDKRKRHISTKGKISWALELIFSPKPENLLNLWGKIGFEYNFERAFTANVAVQYLRLKQKILKEKEEAIKVKIPELLKKRLSYQKIALQLAGNPLTKRFITDICWKLNKGKGIIPRIPLSFPLFKNYLKEVTQGLGQSGMVWDKIKKIEEVSHEDFVYDFTVSHKDHNFVANNFVVSNCIGGVAATDPEDGGVITPGGVGFDINCGIRLIRTNFKHNEIKDKIEGLANTLAQQVPAGLGSKGEIKISQQELKRVVVEGSGWAVGRGYGVQRDLEFTEEKGAIKGANPDKISQRAYERGRAQIGTLGSGNHFCEVQVIDEIYEPEIAKVFNLFKGQITVMIHTGSRGFGHQICSDYLKTMLSYFDKEKLPDRQLVCAPLNSKEGKDYFSAMCCAANYAWANRQCLMHLVRKGFEKFFGTSWENLGMDLIYDVAHNIAKFEKHIVDGKEKTLCVHRKGATRAFPPNHPDIPIKYKSVGQPVIIPGDMGRHSFLLVGTEKAMAETFGSTCHGAGRVMSRTAAKKSINAKALSQELRSKGIIVRTAGRETLSEEAPQAYKDVADVVDVVAGAGISKKVCRMKPVGVIKG